MAIFPGYSIRGRMMTFCPQFPLNLCFQGQKTYLIYFVSNSFYKLLCSQNFKKLLNPTKDYMKLAPRGNPTKDYMKLVPRGKPTKDYMKLVPHDSPNFDCTTSASSHDNPNIVAEMLLIINCNLPGEYMAQKNCHIIFASANRRTVGMSAVEFKKIFLGKLKSKLV